MAYRPSTNLVWAWRNLRAIEDAGYELERPGARDAPTFNLAFHLPEALPPDTRTPPTLDPGGSVRAPGARRYAAVRCSRSPWSGTRGRAAARSTWPPRTRCSSG